MTYDELTATVLEWIGQTGNPVTAGQVPTFIELGEGRIYRELRDRRMITRVYVQSLAAEEPYFVPDDFLEPYGVWDSAYDYEFKDVDDFLDHLDTECAWWTIQGLELLFSNAAPPTANTVFVYWAKPELLSASTASGNMLFQQNPDLFVFASLCEAIPFVRDEERSPIWEARWREALETLSLQNWDAALPSAQTIRARTSNG